MTTATPVGAAGGSSYSGTAAGPPVVMRIALKFQMYPIAALHHIIEVLVHFPGFQLHRLRKARPAPPPPGTPINRSSSSPKYWAAVLSARSS